MPDRPTLGEKEITAEMVDSVGDGILAGLEESAPEIYINKFIEPRTTIDGAVDLRLVAVRAIEALDGFRDSVGLADVYIDEVKALEDF